MDSIHDSYGCAISEQLDLDGGGGVANDSNGSKDSTLITDRKNVLELCHLHFFLIKNESPNF